MYICMYICITHTHIHTWRPQEIRERGAEKVMDYLRRMDASTRTHHLDLAGIGLLTFPLEIVALEQLKSLDVSGNSIEALPSVIGNMGGLELLRVDNNRCGCVGVGVGG